LTRLAKPRVGSSVGLLALGLWVALAPAAAWAHGQMEEPVAEQTMVPGPMSSHPKPAHLELRLPENVKLGSEIVVTAILTGAHDRPIEGAMIAFERPAFWGEGMSGHMLVGEAMTDADGMASITDTVRTSGGVDFEATFVGDGAHDETSAEGHVQVSGDGQLYRSKAGIVVPWLNLWILAGVIALVWGLYLVVGGRVIAIARAGRTGPAMTAVTGARVEGPAEAPASVSTRRQFLGRLLPMGAEAGIGVLGATLVGVVVRSPHTHGNLMSVPATEAAYRRTPLAFVGSHADMREMPMPLEREVSFSKDVLPIFLANGGPHVVRPSNSPPPGGFRLDSFAHVMSKEGVIVPGKPEESEIVEHLLSPSMQMPPSLPPLPMEQIQLVVTWIAQGAGDN
jgi:hypothetical protein